MMIRKKCSAVTNGGLTGRCKLPEIWYVLVRIMVRLAVAQAGDSIESDRMRLTVRRPY